ncbi:SPL family radical SAM protein [Desulforamulus aeronauticus]|uniref:DNA repair photolyase n=1 Tax=Desulforamulus aeronauticus DSM 10349 TaxID=1121421 RepID=A0A1M6NKX4_9FIRM|nr:radical SAM protein [Desulforamulus aeronauticus]SHJ96405.1 DNA repair photolyase [Desulforamulus aeronauticus DSM 10349]
MHYKDAKSILSSKNGMNPYRGCTHGCIYCDSRSECYGMTYTFEDVEVKQNAPQLLEDALRKKRGRSMIATGAMSDPYLPLEKSERLTRHCLEIIDRYGFGFSVITKSDLVLRDMDLLQSIHHKAKCVVQMTLTTYDEALCRILEPNVATTRRRFEVLKELQSAGIPTVVWLTPILPFLNDTEENIQELLSYCGEAGVRGILTFGIGMTLRSGNREYFYQKLDEHFPGMKQRYMRAFGTAYGIKSPNGKTLGKLVKEFCKQNDILCGTQTVFDYLNQLDRPQEQLSLFE